MKTEFVNKEHWRLGEDHCMVRFTDESGESEFFGDFETAETCRIWGHGRLGQSGLGNLEIRGLRADGTAEAGSFVPDAFELVGPAQDHLEGFQAFANRMFSERYAGYKAMRLAFDNLKESEKDLADAQKWNAKFSKEFNEAVEVYVNACGAVVEDV